MHERVNERMPRSPSDVGRLQIIFQWGSRVAVGELEIRAMARSMRLSNSRQKAVVIEGGRDRVRCRGLVFTHA